jgi:NitT/TauT family transport system ATP-binding protein
LTYILKNIHKNYEDLCVLKGFNMSIDEGKVVAIIGPSGCGKTTLLNIVSKIIKPDKGELFGFENKKISYLFQEPRLLPWKTVQNNIEWVIRDIYGKKKEEIMNTYLDLVGLTEYKDYYPKALSGGMKQRVSIARAFAYPSDILLMDEPFKSIDLDRKLEMIESIQKLWAVDRRTVFFVTHDVQEAVLLGDDIYVLTKKPSYIKKIYKNKTTFSKRKINDKGILNLQEEIYKDIYTVHTS